MAIGSTLLAVRKILKAELGVSLTVGSADDALYNQLLFNQQQFFLAGWDWSHLKDRWDKAVVAGDRYLTLPGTDVLGATTAINFERGVEAEVLYLSRYLPIAYGIDTQDYNAFNPDLSQTSAPVQKWQRELGDATKFEIWPASSAVQTIRFTGQRTAPVWDVTDDTSIAYIDDQLLALAVAVDRLSGERSMQATAQLKQGKLQARWTSLRGKDKHRTNFTPGRYEHGRPRLAPSSIRILP